MIPRTPPNPELVQNDMTKGMLDVHPTMCALVVTYQMNNYDDPMDFKEGRKVIKIDNLNKETDIQALTWCVITKAEVIHHNRCQEVEHVLAYLQNRTTAKNEHLEGSSLTLQEQIQDLQGSTETAHMSNLETYLENLYDDLQTKIRGAGLILQLARIPEHLPNLIENESLFPALARVLREEWKKSIELTTNIVYIFFCFATFSVFHNMLAQLKIGFTCMLVLDYEISRHTALQQDLLERKRRYKANPEASKKEYEQGRKKYQMLLKKQEALLRVTLYLLLNLSEDTRVEMKMRNKGLVVQLCLLLDRSNDDLLILVISFLKKLSIYVENKDDMAKSGIIQRLAQMLSSSNEVLVNVTLRLLLNLSFDPLLRKNMVKEGLVTKLSSLLEKSSHRVVVLCILYHISMDRKCRSIFASTDCIAKLMKLILECKDELVKPEEIALAINLATSTRNAQIICDGSGLKLLMRRTLATRDSLLFKMFRNISKCSGPELKKLFLPFLSQLCEVLMECDSEGEAGEEVCEEVLRILGNLTLPEMDFHKVVTELNLLPFILHKIQDRTVSDDLLLEVIVFCGTTALDEKCADLLLQANVHYQLIALIRGKQKDIELILQLIYFLYQILLHTSTRELVMENPLVCDYLMELMHHNNKEINQLCSKALDLASESSEDMAVKIRHTRFRWHNYQWLDMMTEKTLLAEESDEDYVSPNFIHASSGIFDLQTNLDQLHEGYRTRGHSPQGYRIEGHSPQGYRIEGHSPQGYRVEGHSPQDYMTTSYSPRPRMEVDYGSNPDILSQRSKSSLLPSTGRVSSAQAHNIREDVRGTSGTHRISPSLSTFDMDYASDFSPTDLLASSGSSMHSRRDELEGGSRVRKGRIDSSRKRREGHLKVHPFVPSFHQPRPPSTPRSPSASSLRLQSTSPFRPTSPAQLVFSVPTEGDKLTQHRTSPSSSFHVLSPTTSPTSFPVLPASSFHKLSPTTSPLPILPVSSPKVSSPKHSRR